MGWCLSSFREKGTNFSSITRFLHSWAFNSALSWEEREQETVPSHVQMVQLAYVAVAMYNKLDSVNNLDVIILWQQWSSLKYKFLSISIASEPHNSSPSPADQSVRTHCLSFHYSKPGNLLRVISSGHPQCWIERLVSLLLHLLGWPERTLKRRECDSIIRTTGQFSRHMYDHGWWVWDIWDVTSVQDLDTLWWNIGLTDWTQECMKPTKSILRTAVVENMP